MVQGPDYGILVEPVNESELRREVAEFAEYLIQTLQAGDDDSSQEDGAIGTSGNRAGHSEHERASYERRRGQDGRRRRFDHAKQLAQKFLDDDQNAEALAIEMLARMNLHLRNRRELWYSELSGKPPLNWLRDNFVEINNGRNAEFSLPKRIEVLVPKPILAEDTLSIRLVDTKGRYRRAHGHRIPFDRAQHHSLALLTPSFCSTPARGRAIGMDGSGISATQARLLPYDQGDC